MPTGSVLEQESRSPPPGENGKAVEAEQGKRGSGVKRSEEEAALRSGKETGCDKAHGDGLPLTATGSVFGN